jgi:hypothetical protein
VAPGGTEVTTPQIPKAYERSLSATKSGVNPGWSCEADTTQGKTAGGGTPAASDKPAAFGAARVSRRSLAGATSTRGR